ncbi:MAG: tetratricopeptide repeat protein, partial [Candidatus Thermoplasmatota archaeon]|nr:tetratricopeptide repeat protein [Candidatus Thermoplasmatota archaeon]
MEMVLQVRRRVDDMLKNSTFRIIGSIIVISLIVYLFSGQNSNPGFEAYKRGDYVTALNIFRNLATQGDMNAQFNLGVMHEGGKGVPQDNLEAIKWFRIAAEQGKAKAQAMLGYMYGEGKGVPQDNLEAVKWYRKAAKQGYVIAQLHLGSMYHNEGDLKDYKEALKWYR